MKLGLVPPSLWNTRFQGASVLSVVCGGLGRGKKSPDPHYTENRNEVLCFRHLLENHFFSFFFFFFFFRVALYSNEVFVFFVFLGFLLRIQRKTFFHTCTTYVPKLLICSVFLCSIFFLLFFKVKMTANYAKSLR